MSNLSHNVIHLAIQSELTGKDSTINKDKKYLQC